MPFPYHPFSDFYLIPSLSVVLSTSQPYFDNFDHVLGVFEIFFKSTKRIFFKVKKVVMIESFSNLGGRPEADARFVQEEGREEAGDEEELRDRQGVVG